MQKKLAKWAPILESHCTGSLWMGEYPPYHPENYHEAVRERQRLARVAKIDKVLA